MNAILSLIILLLILVLNKSNLLDNFIKFYCGKLSLNLFYSLTSILTIFLFLLFGFFSSIFLSWRSYSFFLITTFRAVDLTTSSIATSNLDRSWSSSKLSQLGSESDSSVPSTYSSVLSGVDILGYLDSSIALSNSF